MKTLLWMITLLVAIFAGLGGIITMLMMWAGAYIPYVNGPDPLLLLLWALVLVRLVLEDVE